MNRDTQRGNSKIPQNLHPSWVFHPKTFWILCFLSSDEVLIEFSSSLPSNLETSPKDTANVPKKLLFQKCNLRIAHQRFRFQHGICRYSSDHVLVQSQLSSSIRECFGISKSQELIREHLPHCVFQMTCQDCEE